MSYVFRRIGLSTTGPGGICGSAGVKSRLYVLRLVLPGMILVAGCAHFPVNEPLNRSYHDKPEHADHGYIYNGSDGDELLVALSLSGGGTRAAAFAFGVIKALYDTEIGPPEQRRRLLDEVDLVSSVSGGGFTAAYWAAHGDQKLIRDFRDDFLYQNVDLALNLRFLWPRNWFRLMGGRFERVDVFAEYLDDQLFQKEEPIKFDHLIGKRPFFLFNATDISYGTRFGFSQKRFDQLCSDLDKYPLARAVAASSAVPVLNSPITLKNYGWGACGYEPPKSVSPNLRQTVSLPQLRREKAQDSQRDATKRPWIHLVDGGLVDNLGVQGLYDLAFDLERPCPDSKKLRHLVVIVVDAAIELDHDVDLGVKGPKLNQELLALLNIPIDRISDQTVESLCPRLEEWVKKCTRGESPKIDVILVRIPDDEIPDTGERLLRIKTGLSLPRKTVNALIDAGQKQFNREAERLGLVEFLSQDANRTDNIVLSESPCSRSDTAFTLGRLGINSEKKAPTPK